jgi:hypothetical protein
VTALLLALSLCAAPAPFPRHAREVPAVCGRWVAATGHTITLRPNGACESRGWYDSRWAGGWRLEGEWLVVRERQDATGGWREWRCRLGALRRLGR